MSEANLFSFLLLFGFCLLLMNVLSWTTEPMVILSIFTSSSQSHRIISVLHFANYLELNKVKQKIKLNEIPFFKFFIFLHQSGSTLQVFSVRWIAVSFVSRFHFFFIFYYSLNLRFQHCVPWHMHEYYYFFCATQQQKQHQNNGFDRFKTSTFGEFAVCFLLCPTHFPFAFLKFSTKILYLLCVERRKQCGNAHASAKSRSAIRIRPPSSHSYCFSAKIVWAFDSFQIRNNKMQRWTLKCFFYFV